MNNTIAGFHSSHDCSFSILEEGVPLIHVELERYIRLKEPMGDGLEFLFANYDNYEHLKYFTTMLNPWNGGIAKRYPESWKKLQGILKKNDGKLYTFGHHQCHAANAFYSSNLEEALIITIDGGGTEVDDNSREVTAHLTVWLGKGNKIERLAVFSDDGLNCATNIGGFWTRCTKDIFGLSAGYPYGHQAGTVMALAALGNFKKYFSEFNDYLKVRHHPGQFNFQRFKDMANWSDQSKYDIAAALQTATEERIKYILDIYLQQTNQRNICLSGGVSLNCVMAGKIYDWFEGRIDKVYADPVPYDANSTSYLGYTYSKELIDNALNQYATKLEVAHINDDLLVDLLIDKNIIAVYGKGSESGRRALGNRSILADPRHADTKDIVNERVKHRQWFRPFAPSIIREEVKNWFIRDIDSPYMSFAIKFKDDCKNKVPAVVHFDGTARLQTVTKKDNSWYYGLINNFFKKTDVPILLNTSFNDREPIVETPEHAINCFLKTNIDYLYFYEYGLLVSKKGLLDD